jgi:hypothetical protein
MEILAWAVLKNRAERTTVDLKRVKVTYDAWVVQLAMYLVLSHGMLDVIGFDNFSPA